MTHVSGAFPKKQGVFAAVGSRICMLYNTIHFIAPLGKFVLYSSIYKFTQKHIASIPTAHIQIIFTPASKHKHTYSTKQWKTVCPDSDTSIAVHSHTLTATPSSTSNHTCKHWPPNPHAPASHRPQFG